MGFFFLSRKILQKVFTVLPPQKLGKVEQGLEKEMQGTKETSGELNACKNYETT